MAADDAAAAAEPVPNKDGPAAAGALKPENPPAPGSSMNYDALKSSNTQTVQDEGDTTLLGSKRRRQSGSSCWRGRHPKA